MRKANRCIAGLALALMSCGHASATNQPLYSSATAPQARAGTAVRGSKQTGVTAFDEYLAMLEASGDPIGRHAASMLRDLVARAAGRAQCGNRNAPLDVATYTGNDALARAVADALDVGLARHPDFRVTHLRDERALNAVLQQLYRGPRKEETLPDIGRWESPRAIAIVRTQPMGGAHIVTVRLTCLEQGVDIAAARALIAADAVPADPPTVRCETAVAAGNTREFICCLHPNLPSCQMGGEPAAGGER